MEKFLGVGLVNALGLFLLFVVMLVTLKSVAQAYQVPGLKSYLSRSLQIFFLKNLSSDFQQVVDRHLKLKFYLS